MTHTDPVRAIHDAAAHSPDPAIQSVRPNGTSERELSRMIADVIDKLQPTPDSCVLEIGCGTGVLALPLAKRVRRYVGVDFAEEALDVLASRFADLGLETSTSLLALDLSGRDAPAKVGSGEFDRVLMYAVLHYARSDDDAHAFLETAASALAPGGRALIGNIPVEDLAAPLAAVRATHGGVRRILRFLGWLLTPTNLGHTRRWKLIATLHVLARKLEVRRAGGTADTASLPPGTCVTITCDRLADWLGSLPVSVTPEYLPPRPGTPLAIDRVDVVLIRSDDPAP